ncbi:hypothetical protein [Pectinatus frisingensis]|uniref:hypothetical protein n=1 Tax=Pectinatus frisingensis TaxID=865 RepID=UPI003D8077F0
MIERNLLIGNGINIEFSGNDDYKNYKIIERLTQNICTNKYYDVFQGTLNQDDLKKMIILLNEEFNKIAETGKISSTWLKTKSDCQTLMEILARYHGESQNILSIGMEDYFFIMRLLNNSVGNTDDTMETLFQGLRYLFLDAIYNNGEIETLYEKMNCYKKELLKYKNIFTINYDANIDKLTNKRIFHLHGSFNVLDDTYRPETIIGYLALQNHSLKVIPKLKHIYCNGIMGYSGEYKMERMERYSSGNMAINKLMHLSDQEREQYYTQLKSSTKESDIYVAKVIKACLAHPELKYNEYPIKQFENINGELHIIGMSPNNDSHIFKMINENPHISNIVYFSANDDDTKNIQKVINKTVQIRNIFKYWKSLIA